MDKDKILEMIEDKMTEDSKKSPNRYDDPTYIDKYYKDFAAEFRKGTMEEIIEFLDDLPDRQLEYASDI
ncbi:MAG: hypothetical protein LUG24_03950 [Clostridiales bacterium]|nr:hypothetical protein [Clostridiales bacterium]